MVFSRKKYLLRPLAPVLLLLVLAGCSTKKNTLVNRSYHNLTSRYNGYFNATLRVKDGAQRLAESHEDKYDRILSVFRYSNEQKAKAVYPLMDEAIKKSSLVIHRHSMVIKGKEYCKWIDDNYFLIGQARFYKHEFLLALETFQFVAAQYRNEPIRFDALLWQARTHMMLKNMAEAEEIMTFLKNDAKFPQRLRGDYYALAAEMAVREKNYPQAIEHLNKAVVLAKKRYDRTRYLFILAQLNQLTGENAKAYNLYEQVVKRNPPYEMAFNAKISRAVAFDLEGRDSRDLKKQLQKMLRDDKNIDYHDQIYYSLAIVALKEKDEPAALGYFEKSVRASRANLNQKALSYLEMAKIYFARPEYKLAQAYYDSTVSSLSKDYPDYEQIVLRRNSLSKLVRYLTTISTEDSLQRIARMTEKEREEFIDDLYNRDLAAWEQKKLQKEEEQLTQNTILNTQNDPSNSTVAAGGGFYFTNPSAISFGFTEFLKKWGNRANEDNWRRSSKELELASGEEEEETGSGPTGSSKTASADGKPDKQKYFDNLPLTDKQIDQSTGKIMDAYYNLALLYREQLNDMPEASRTFETLLKRFPNSRYELPSWYQLYRIYLNGGNEEKAAYYKNLILSKYPDSESAQIIRNPGYVKEMAARASRLEKYYEETFQLFRQREYNQVIARRAQADSLFPVNKLLPKFDYLKALCIGHTRPAPEFETALGEVIKKHPNDPVKDQASQMLEYLKKQKQEGDTTPVKMPPQVFMVNPDTVYFYVITFPNNSLDANQLKIRLSDYNTSHYSAENLTLTSVFLNASTQLVGIKEFAGMQKAMDYYKGIKDNPDVFGGFANTGLTQFVISADNFSRLFQNRDLPGYLAFFKQNIDP